MSNFAIINPLSFVAYFNTPGSNGSIQEVGNGIVIADPTTRQSTGTSNVIIGNSSRSTVNSGNNNVIIGIDAGTTAEAVFSSVAIGNAAVANVSGVSLGAMARADGTNTIAIGSNTLADANGVALGFNANATAGGISLGNDSATTATAGFSVTSQIVGAAPGAATASWRVKINGTEYFIPLTPA
jgi:hypothetical protein